MSDRILEVPTIAVGTTRARDERMRPRERLLSRPRSVVALVLLVGAAVLAPATFARATVGTDTRLEILGYDADRDRVMLLRCAGEVEAPEGCGLLLLSLATDRLVRSRDFEAASTDAQARWVERLRRRLAPLERIARGSVVVRRTIERRYRRYDAWSEADVAFMTVCVHVEVDGRASETRVEAFDHARIRVRDAFRIPGRDAALVVFAYHGDPFESGYDVDAALLVR